ncbi:MAG: hypothetical protein H7Y60_09185 [Rhodospirillaceae bacterium]|nr:hypothetical protein [Rhodospirillales bacterium]
MLTIWADEARRRFSAGDFSGAALAATLANDDDGPCPFTEAEAELVAGWHDAADLRARVQAQRERRAHRDEPAYKPHSGSTSAAHSAKAIDGLDF